MPRAHQEVEVAAINYRMIRVMRLSQNILKKPSTTAVVLHDWLRVCHSTSRSISINFGGSFLPAEK